MTLNISQETVLNWFGIEDSNAQDIRKAIENGYQIDFSDTEQSPYVSLETIRLIVEGLWDKIQNGLTLADIENVLFFILFIRFLILSIRYNLKTSFYITCIGIIAGYLWYRHLIDLVSMYRNVLLKLPFLNNIGMNEVRLRQMALTDPSFKENAHWYNPGQVLYYGFTKGIINVDSDSGFKYYIDPLSMFVSNLQEQTKSKILPLYYDLYNSIIPKIYDICSKFWGQLSGIAAYAVITRVGKRYCPYLIRWHWTFLLIIAMVEQILSDFIYRVYSFRNSVLFPQLDSYDDNDYINIIIVDLKIDLLNVIVVCVVLTHIGFVLFGLFHAVCGQYFYVPFFVENTELHIGPRPKNSIYSGGNTAWQETEEKQKSLKSGFPKVWYGWFGRGSKGNWRIIKIIKKIIIRIIRKFRKKKRKFRKKLKK